MVKKSCFLIEQALFPQFRVYTRIPSLLIPDILIPGQLLHHARTRASAVKYANDNGLKIINY